MAREHTGALTESTLTRVRAPITLPLSRTKVEVGQSSVAIEAAAGEGSNGLVSAGIAAAVLAVGLLGGLGLRRLLRSG